MTAPDPAHIATLRAIWPDIVRAKGGWPPEPVATLLDGEPCFVDPRDEHEVFMPEGREIPDPTLPGTRAAVLAWLGLPTYRAWARTVKLDRPDIIEHAEHTPATFLATLVRWHAEHCG